MKGASMKRDGFTLLEVIIVLTLITLVLGLSTVYFAGFLPAVRFEATGREITALIRHARSLARMQGEKQTIMIDLDERSYGLKGGAIKKIPPSVLIRIVDPVSGDVLQGKYPFVFPSAGGVEGGAVILSMGKKKLRIELDPITGAVVIKGG
jgi:general secretion pathway protein H